MLKMYRSREKRMGILKKLGIISAIMMAPSVFGVPILLKIENHTDFDIVAGRVTAKNIDLVNIDTLKNQSIEAHHDYTFSLERTGDSARIFLDFFIESTEGRFAGYEVARWEYEEDPAQPQTGTEVCHLYSGVYPYTINCAGDNNYNKPIVTLQIEEVPQPIIPQVYPTPPQPLPSP